MLPIRCGIVDDKPLAIDIIRTYMERVPFLTLVYTTTNPLEALGWVNQKLVELVFLDIQMPELTGVQFMKITEARVSIILTTAYPDYALKGFEHSALDYLLKPISFERFYKAASKARDWLAHCPTTLPLPVNPVGSPRDYLFVKVAHKIAKVFFSSIKYAEAMQNYTILHTTDGKVITLQSLKQMEDQLPAGLFIRVHKSYLINISRIDTVERNRIYISDVQIPVGETYQNTFLKVLKLP